MALESLSRLPQPAPMRAQSARESWRPVALRNALRLDQRICSAQKRPGYLERFVAIIVHRKAQTNDPCC